MCMHDGVRISRPPHRSQKLADILGLIGWIYCVLLLNTSDYLMRGMIGRKRECTYIRHVLGGCCCGNEQVELVADIQ
jgi:hypothetical protein